VCLCQNNNIRKNETQTSNSIHTNLKILLILCAFSIYAMETTPHPCGRRQLQNTNALTPCSHFTHCCTVRCNSTNKMVPLLRFVNRRLHTDVELRPIIITLILVLCNLYALGYYSQITLNIIFKRCYINAID